MVTGHNREADTGAVLLAKHNALFRFRWVFLVPFSVPEFHPEATLRSVCQRSLGCRRLLPTSWWRTGTERQAVTALPCVCEVRGLGKKTPGQGPSSGQVPAECQAAPRAPLRAVEASHRPPSGGSGAGPTLPGGRLAGSPCASVGRIFPQWGSCAFGPSYSSFARVRPALVTGRVHVRTSKPEENVYV